MFYWRTRCSTSGPNSLTKPNGAWPKNLRFWPRSGASSAHRRTLKRSTKLSAKRFAAWSHSTACRSALPTMKTRPCPPPGSSGPTSPACGRVTISRWRTPSPVRWSVPKRHTCLKRTQSPIWKAVFLVFCPYTAPAQTLLWRCRYYPGM